MKKLLLLIFTVAGLVTANAQGTCATATPVTAGSTVTVSGITGTNQVACNNVNGELTTGALGMWYSYTATANGQVTLSSNLPQNVAPNSDDTRVSVYSGTCASLVCVGGSDDISATNYLTTFTFDVLTGNTYYIQWDNRWSAAGFDFSVAFTALTCFPVNTINEPTNLTTTSATLNWVAATGAPASYQVEYGPVGFTQGAGTTLTTSTNSITITGLTAATTYDFYIRSNCGSGGFSAWTAVNSFNTLFLCPYTSGLDTTPQLQGWTIGTNGPGAQGLNSTGTAGQASTPGYWIFTSSTTTANNNWLYSPPFSLQANEVVTISFYHRASTSARTLRVTVGNDNTTAAQTTVLATVPIPVGTTWTQVTVPAYTAPAAGAYYFGFNDNSAATPTAVNMRLDSFSFTSVLGTNDYLTSKFSVYPNPANNVVNFSNDVNAVVSTVAMADLNGRVVKSTTVNATEGNISISDLATGIYMMTITTDQGVAVKKIVKQ